VDEHVRQEIRFFLFCFSKLEESENHASKTWSLSHFKEYLIMMTHF